MVVALTFVTFMLAGTSCILASTPVTPHKACGVRGQSSVTGAKITGPSFQIIGGEDAEPQEFPWQISLQYIVPPGNNLGHGCGGSIINKQYVLTAAHCVDRVAPNSRLVIVGEYNLNQTDPLERKVAVSSALGAVE
ncbi:plasma kallikrein-like [Ixodes scapularis]